MTSSDLDVSSWDEIGYVYETWMSPWQEPGEEEEAPPITPETFLSTEPSRSRSERDERGYARLSFLNDLSKAFVEVKVTDLDLNSINMFHIHAGKPDQLGPILIDFAYATDIIENFKDDGIFQLELTAADIQATLDGIESLPDAFLQGVLIDPEFPAYGKVKTISGMETIANKGELYLNLHTTGQTFFGDIRGKLKEADEETIEQARSSLKDGIPTPPAPNQQGHHGDTSTSVNTITGTSGDDTLKGSKTDDQIKGRQGDDLIRGRAGADHLKGEQGNDTLRSGQGNDTLIGGKGNDELIARDGNKSMKGGKGADVFRLDVDQQSAATILIRDLSDQQGDTVLLPSWAENYSLTAVDSGTQLLAGGIDLEISGMSPEEIETNQIIQVS